MPPRPWQDLYSKKLVSARAALSNICNGNTIFVGSGAGEPFHLTETLARMASKFWDIQVIHLTAAQVDSKLAKPELANHIRYSTFYGGRGGVEESDDKPADNIPMFISELPAAFQSRIVPLDVALVQVSPPDSFGLCSLGVSVDATKAAVENASLVIAQVNKNMPVTLGDSLVPVESIDYLVESDMPLLAVRPPELDPVSLSIGRHIAGLIFDGMTLHFDHGPISAATLRYLDTRKDLGIHTDILTDDILRLIKSRAVTNIKKKLHKGKTVATMVIGSKDLYDTVNANPYIEILPIDQVNDPNTISDIERMVSIHSIQEIELTGLARADMEQISQIRSFPSTIDFIYGTNFSKSGFTILALPSTTRDGVRSRIVPISTGGGVAFARAKVHFVATEYGVVNLYGRSVRERAIALISIAHPKFRRELLEEAKRLRFVEQEQVIPPESGCAYPAQYEFTHTLDDGTDIFFRPVRPTDARRLQRMFYSLSPEARRMRYHDTKKLLSNEMAQKLAAVDYSRDMAIIGLVGPRSNARVIAEARYTYNPGNKMGEFDIIVHDDFRGHGLGTLLANHLGKIAYSRGLSGVYAEVIPENAATVALLNRAWPTAERHFEYGTCSYILKFPPEDVERPKDSIIVYSGRFGDYPATSTHPFSPERARAALQLIITQGFLQEPWIRVEEPRMVSKERLIESHDPALIDAISEANSGKLSRGLSRFNLGGGRCPVFPGIFDYVLLYTSATLTAADLIIKENANVVFSPLGGFHHATRSECHRFCYVNDVIVLLDSFLAQGFRVAYIDLDAHHGGGVQDAYYRDDRVLFVSLHERANGDRPGSGSYREIGEGIGANFTVNIPLPQGTDDESYTMLFDRIVTPAVTQFVPSVVVAVVGSDSHRSNPLTRLNITNSGMAQAMTRIRDYCKHLVLLGGEGENSEVTARAWCRVWATANRIDTLPEYMRVKGGTLARRKVRTAMDIDDAEYCVTGEKKDQILRELEEIVSFHSGNTLPGIGKRNRVTGSARRD